jgi:hypothetical protein
LAIANPFYFSVLCAYGLVGVTGGVVVGGVVGGTPGCVGWVGVVGCGSLGLVVVGVELRGGVVAGVVVWARRALLLGALGATGAVGSTFWSGFVNVLSLFVLGRLVVVRGLFMVSVCAEARPKARSAASV